MADTVSIEPFIPRPLDAIRVLELASGSHAVAYCGRVLAAVGADVRPVDVSLDAGRAATSARRAADAYEGTGKRAAIRPRNERTLLKVVRDLVSTSDVLIEALPAGHPALAAVDRDALEATRLIHVSVTPFGRYGSASGLRTTPFVTAHAAGEAAANPSGLDVLDHPPRTLPGHMLDYDAGSVAASLVLVALLEGGGSYRYCDLSIQDVGATMLRADVATALETGVEVDRSTRALQVGGTFRCRDGWVGLAVREDRQWGALASLMGRAALAETHPTEHARSIDALTLHGEVGKWLAAHGRDKVVARAQAAGIPLTPILEPHELASAPANVRRGLLGARDGGVSVRRALPALFLAPPDAPHAIGVPRGGSAGRPADAPRPLSGTRVVEIASVWAAPTASMYLAMLGADVVKLEAPSHPDRTRRIPGDPTSISFHVANSGKRSVVADLDTADGRRTFATAVRTADAVISTAGPNLLARNGIGYTDVARRHPALVWVDVSTLGAEGATRTLGYADAFAGLSGVSALNRYPGGPPADIGNAADFRAAYDVLLCALVGLLVARRTGRGSYVDVSCAETLTLRIGDLISGPPLGVSSDALDSDRHLVALASDGTWVACDVLSDADRAALLGGIGRVRPGAAGVAAHYAEWARERSGRNAAAALRSWGLPASVSMSNAELARLSHMRERRLIRAVSHDDGTSRLLPRELMGVPWHSPADRWPSLTHDADEPMPPGPALGARTPASPTRGAREGPPAR